MRWRKQQARPEIGPDDDVFIVDVTEHWYEGQHGYWAFTNPTWYSWAVSGDGLAAPDSLVAANPQRHLPAAPTANDRALYLVGGAYRHGAYVGSEADELHLWLAGRQPLGILTADEWQEPETL